MFGEILDTIGRELSVSKSNRLHANCHKKNDEMNERTLVDKIPTSKRARECEV